MTLLKLFNTSPANSPKDDVGGSNAQLESKGRDQRPSPPKDDVDVGSTEAATLRGSSSISFLRSKVGLACLGIIVLALLVVSGVGIFQYNSASAPAAGRIQQQETLFVADNRGGKAGKEPSLLCDSPVKCGDTIPGTGKKKLTFFQDLVCTEEPQPGEECAITVSGEDVELDCNDFMITSTSGSWKYGICVSNRAKAMNCLVQRFGVRRRAGAGIRIENGGEIEDSEVMFNYSGILVEGSQDSTSTTKISDTFIHDNGSTGIRFKGETGSESSIQIEGVRSISNNGYGMFFESDVDTTMILRVKDSETSYNKGGGLGSVLGAAGGSIDFEVEGFFNSRYNGYDGVFLRVGEMKVKGVVNLYKNRERGLYVGSAVNVVVDKGGALNSCSNNQGGYIFGSLDIYNDGSGTFSGDGYTCGTEDNSGTGSSTGANLPVCKACPSCPSE
mmetsp:Transcript_12420/g.18529  ORF Transcript_12420/g.18529 Transcript_12420/m.18529 type:complete len:444 (+) Transcript_12420:92-1423(+)